MGRVFDRAYAPSTLGSFLRSFTFGHVRQLDAVASRFLANLTAQAGQAPQVVGDGTGGRVLVDVDDTIIEVHGYAKQGAGFGYSGVRGLNALIATATTAGSAPVVVAQRLRKGSCGSPRGAKRLVADALKTVRTLHGRSGVKPLLRADSAFYGAPTVVPRSAAGPRCRSPCAWTPRSRPRSPPSASTRGRPSSTPTPSSTRSGHVGVAGRGRRGALHRVHLQEGHRTGARAAGGAPHPRPEPEKKQAPGRAPCSTPGASTPSSPPPTPPTWTPWPRTRPTAGTRSSSRSTPT